MPSFNGDPSRVSATLEVLPKDDYEFTAGEPKAFLKKNDDGTVKNFGLRIKLITQNEGPQKGKPVVHTLWYHTDGALPMNKRFIMATLGYPADKENERRFDKDVEGKDWNIDFETGAVGDAYREMVGKRVVGNFDVKLDANMNQQQDIKGWRPL